MDLRNKSCIFLKFHHFHCHSHYHHFHFHMFQWHNWDNCRDSLCKYWRWVQDIVLQDMNQRQLFCKLDKILKKKNTRCDNARFVVEDNNSIIRIHITTFHSLDDFKVLLLISQWSSSIRICDNEIKNHRTFFVEKHFPSFKISSIKFFYFIFIVMILTGYEKNKRETFLYDNLKKDILSHWHVKSYFFKLFIFLFFKSII